MAIAWDILKDLWAVLCEMSPYLLFGFFVAGLLSVVISPRTVEKHLGGKGFWPVLKAAAFGVPLPLCSCGVIPVSASLRRHGASKGATVGFLISTPQTGVDSILVTLSLLGGVFAIFRPLIALGSGLIGGMIVSATDKDKPDKSLQESPACTDHSASHTPGLSAAQKFRHVFAYGFGTLARDIGRSLVIGLVLAALISALVPQDKLGPVLGGGIVAMLIMMAVGIPLYVCATASVPVAAALIAKGVSPGAALVFLMTGPATNAATIATIWRVLGRRTAVVYLLTVAGAALSSGLLLDYVFRVTGSVAEPGMGWMLPKPVQWTSAAVLLGVLANAVLRRKPTAGEVLGDSREPTMQIKIKGMTCSHCVASVRRALLECPGVQSVEVSLSSGEANIVGQDIDEQAMRQAVKSIGYEVVAVSPN